MGEREATRDKCLSRHAEYGKESPQEPRQRDRPQKGRDALAEKVEVFEKEQSNESCIHLYLEECGWCAYEVSAYLLMNLLGGKCIVEKIEKCGLKLVRAFLNIDLLGGINYGEPLCGLKLLQPAINRKR